jgi:hypothetical protein
LLVDVSSEVAATLALFRAAGDGGETELMLDRAAGIRARWTGGMPGGLPPPGLLIAEGERAARIAAPSPSGHGH